MTVKILRGIFLATGLFFFIDGLFMAAASNFTIGIVLTLLVGVFFICAGIFYNKIKTLTQKGFLRIVRWLVILGIAFAFLLCGFVFVYGNVPTADHNEDVIMTLGCAVHGTIPSQPLAARLDAAIEEYEKNPSAFMLVSGGQGFQEEISEGEAMARYLIEKGIPEDKIIKEDKSTSTSENFRFSKEILDERFDSYSIAIVTNDFHLYRAHSIAKLEGLDVKRIKAKTPWYSAPMMYSREVLAVLKLWVFDFNQPLH